MCGICGFAGSADNYDAEAVIKAMADKIIHRGPDDSGYYTDDYYSAGFRRLSFIDLDNGAQPIYNEDRTILVTFNGEIYNYKKLRAQLEAKGHVFSNNSDTETLVHLYEEYGTDMIRHLRGMFAFVIYDMEKKELFGARDFFGIKPMYYTFQDGLFMYASEIKSFLAHPSFKKELNPDALENYMTFQYSVLEECFFKGVYKLMPAHYFTYKDGQFETHRYFEPMFNPEEATLTSTVDEIDKVIQNSIEAHKVSDVEVGSFLSSGVDSSFVAACFNGDKTFSVGFDYDKYNEISYAKEFSKEIGIDNYNKTITKEEYWAAIPKIMYHMDEPLADPAAVALFFVAQLASQHVKAALSGEGADEFFGGYNIYREPLDLKILTDMPRFVRKLLAKLAVSAPFSFKGKNYLIRAGKSVEERFIGNANIFSIKEREKLLKNFKGFTPQDITKPLYEKVSGEDDITKMQYIDINLWLAGDILLKADKMSMANSLEVRVPFLDKKVFKVASRIQPDFRVNRTATKYAFRLAAKSHMPQSVAEKKKLGFPVPIRIWLKEDKYYDRVMKDFTSAAAESFFNTEELKKLLSDHKTGKADNSRKIWTVYCFLVWYNQFFSNTP